MVPFLVAGPGAGAAATAVQTQTHAQTQTQTHAQAHTQTHAQAQTQTPTPTPTQTVAPGDDIMLDLVHGGGAAPSAIDEYASVAAAAAAAVAAVAAAAPSAAAPSTALPGFAGIAGGVGGVGRRGGAGRGGMRDRGKGKGKASACYRVGVASAHHSTLREALAAGGAAGSAASGAAGAAGAEGSASGQAGLSDAPRLAGQGLATGTHVKRGADWKYHNEDGGPGKQGVVVSGTDQNSDGWVRVQWDMGGVNVYRWGAENSFDVEPVHVSLCSSAVRIDDLVALREAAAQDDSAAAAHKVSSVPADASDVGGSSSASRWLQNDPALAAADGCRSRGRWVLQSSAAASAASSTAVVAPQPQRARRLMATSQMMGDRHDFVMHVLPPLMTAVAASSAFPATGHMHGVSSVSVTEVPSSLSAALSSGEAGAGAVVADLGNSSAASSGAVTLGLGGLEVALHTGRGGEGGAGGSGSVGGALIGAVGGVSLMDLGAQERLEEWALQRFQRLFPERISARLVTHARGR